MLHPLQEWSVLCLVSVFLWTNPSSQSQCRLSNSLWGLSYNFLVSCYHGLYAVVWMSWKTLRQCSSGRGLAFDIFWWHIRGWEQAATLYIQAAKRVSFAKLFNDLLELYPFSQETLGCSRFKCFTQYWAELHTIDLQQCCMFARLIRSIVVLVLKTNDKNMSKLGVQ